MYKILVIDFDNIYDMEKEDEVGVAPSLYLIPEDKEQEIKALCKEAYDDFFAQKDSSLAILDIFETLLASHGIKFQYIGSLNSLTFGERQSAHMCTELSVINANGADIE